MEKFEIGEKITFYSNYYKRERPEGVGILKERLTTYPTKGQWTLAQWEIEVFDRYEGHMIISRPILEVGNPNENIAEDLNLDRYLNPFKYISDESGEVVVKEKKKRGRKPKDRSNEIEKPKGKRGRKPVAMNELKAKNTIRFYINGNKKFEPEELIEAAQWLENNGFSKWIGKWF